VEDHRRLVWIFEEDLTEHIEHHGERHKGDHCSAEDQPKAALGDDLRKGFSYGFENSHLQRHGLRKEEERRADGGEASR
jgi:hypothetical protein